MEVIRRIGVVLLVLVAGTASVGWAQPTGLTITGLSDQGSADPLHPAEYLIDGRLETAFRAAPGSSRAWVVVELQSTKRVLGLRLQGEGNGSESLSVEYDDEGAWRPFLSAVGRSLSWEGASALIDLSWDAAESSRIRVTVAGDDLSLLELREMEVYGEGLAGALQVVQPESVSASWNTSDYADEYDLFDGNPATYWLVQDGGWGPRHPLVDEYAHGRRGDRRERGQPYWGEGYVQADLEGPTLVKALRLYGTSEAKGQYTVEVQPVSGGRQTLVWRQAAFAGWTSIPVNMEITAVRIRTVPQMWQQVSGGFGELEIWGTPETRTAPVRAYVLAPFEASSFDAIGEGIFSWDPDVSGRTASVAATFAADGAVPTLELNGREHSPRLVQSVGSEQIATYAVEPGTLWDGDNYVRFLHADGQAVVPARAVRVQGPGRDGSVSDLPLGGWSDGLCLVGTTPLPDGELGLGRMRYLSHVDVFTGGQSIGGVSAKVGDDWQPLNAEGGAEGGKFSFAGNMTTDRLRVEGGGQAVNEVRVWASPTEPVPLALDVIYPSPNLTMPLQHHGDHALYGTVSDSRATVTVNARAVRRDGAVFWIELRDLALQRPGAVSATVVATTPDGRRAELSRTWINDGAGIELDLDDEEGVVYTRAEAYTVHGHTNAPYSAVYVNGQEVPQYGGWFSAPVVLRPGLNLIEVEQRDRWSGAVMNLRYLRVYRQTAPPAVQVTSHPAQVYTTASSIVLRGDVQGIGPFAVMAGWWWAAVQGTSWTSLPILLHEGSNTIVVLAVDRTGAQTSAVVTVVRDTAAPTITLSHPAMGAELATADVAVDGVVVDGSPVRVFANGIAMTVDGSSYSGELHFQDGGHTIQAFAQDRAGNLSPVVSTSFIVDTTPPAPFVPAIEPASWYSGTTHTATFATSDATTSVAYYEGSVGGEDFVQVTSPWSFHIPDDGRHPVFIKAVDRVGNVRIGQAYAYVDRMPPEAVYALRAVPGNESIFLRWLIDEPEFREVELVRSPAFPDGTRIYPASLGRPWEQDSVPHQLRFEVEDGEAVEGVQYTYSARVRDRAENLSAPVSSVPAELGVAQTPYDPVSGAVVEFDGVSVSVPPGVTTEPNVSIRVSTLDDSGIEEVAVVPPVSLISSLELVQEGSSGTVVIENPSFEKPLVVVMEYDPAALPVGFPEERLSAFYFDSEWSTWMRVKNSLVDSQSHSVVFATDHFTPFAIMPTEGKEISPQERANVQFGLGSTRTRHEGLSVSQQTGSVSTRMTEFTLDGRDGFTFTLERFYDTVTAREDVFTDQQGYVDAGGTYHAVDGTPGGGIFGQSGQGRRNAGDYALSLGNGWRLNLPFIRISDGGYAIRTPDGASHRYYDLDFVSNSQTGLFDGSRTLVLANHRGGDFLLTVDQTRGLFSSWKPVHTVLTMKDGTSYEFDDRNLLTEIRSPYSTQAITLTYEDSGRGYQVLDYITDSMGRTLDFTYSYEPAYNWGSRPSLTGITLTSPGAAGGLACSYVFDSDRNLSAAVDVGGRTYAYAYETHGIRSATAEGRSVDEVAGSLSADAPSLAGTGAIRGAVSADYGSLMVEQFFALRSLTGPGLGYQSVAYETVPVLYSEDGTAAAPFTRLADQLQAQSLTVRPSKDAGTPRTTTYAYSRAYSHSSGKQILPIEGTADDTCVKTRVTYDAVETSSSRWHLTAAGAMKVEKEEEVFLPYANRTESTDLTVGEGVLVETVTTEVDTRLRPTTRTTSRDESHTRTVGWQYDQWSSATSVDTVDTIGSRTLQERTRRLYTGTEEAFWTLDPLSEALLSLPSGTTLESLRANAALGPRDLALVTVTYQSSADTDIGFSWSEYRATVSVQGDAGSHGKITDSYAWLDTSGQWLRTSYAYAPGGELEALTSPMEHVTTTNWDYGSLGEGYYSLTRIEDGLVDADGNPLPAIAMIKVFDARMGDLSAERDGRGYWTTHTNDALGRVTSIYRPGDADLPVPAYGDLDRSARTRATHPLTEVLYDDAARTVTVTRPNGAHEVYGFDAFDQVVSIVQGYRAPQTPEGVAFTGHGDVGWGFSYDPWGRLATSTDPRTLVTSFAYDGMGTLTTMTLPAQDGEHEAVTRRVSIGWSTLQRTSYDEENNRVDEELDFGGRVLRRTAYLSSGNVVSSSWYAPDGRLLRSSDGRGYVTANSYDTRGLLVAQELPESLQVGKSYNSDGFLTGQSTTQGTRTDAVAYTVDAIGRTIKASQSFSSHLEQDGALAKDAVAVSRSYYDADSRPTRQVDPNNLETWTTYTARGRPWRVTDPAIQSTTYEYDLSDSVVRVVDPRQGSEPGDAYAITFTYDDLNRMVLASPPPVLGETVRAWVYFEYDQLGRVTRRLDASGKQTASEYNGRGWLSSEVLSGSVSGSPALETTYAYDELGLKSSVTAPGGRTTTFGYDELGRQTLVSFPEGNTNRFSYDANGNVSTEVDGRGILTSTDYDGLNRATSVRTGTLPAYAYGYDLLGRMTESIDPTGITNGWVYDERGLVLQATDGRALSQSYSYDAGGRLAGHTDRGGTVRTYAYDNHNLVTSVTATGTDGTVQVQGFTYDSVGNLMSASDGGIATAYNVMPLGSDPALSYRSDPYGLVHRAQESVGGASRTVSYDWDAFQRLQSLGVDVFATLDYTYDVLSRITSLSGVTPADGFRYDATTGRLGAVSLANGILISCGYDGNDRVTGIGYTRGVETLKSIDLDYDGNANVVRKNDSSYGYDERDMLLEADMHDRFAADIREAQTAGIAERDVSGQGELVCPEVESTFELDVNANSVGVDLGRNREVYGIVVTPAGAGNRLAKDNLEVWLRGSGQATWDELSRDDYVVEKDAQGGMDIRFRVPLTARYAKLHQLFDERDVEDQDVGVPTVINGSSVLLKLRYFVADRVESYSYDAAGKRQSLGVTFDGQARPGVSYSYYAGSELLKSDGRWGYRYDGNGNLVEKGEYWADGGTEITVQHPAGSAAWRYGWDLYNRLVKVERWEEGSYAVVASYQYNHRGLRVHRIGSDGLTRYLYDQEGNVVLTSYADGSSEQQVWVGGKLVQRIARDAAGAEVARRYLSTDHLGTVVMVTDEAGQIVSEGNYTPFGEDAGPSGLEELALRYTGKDVDPDTCLVYVNARWLDTSTGRFISEDPVLDGTLWFAYVNNNPLTLVDPSGMEGQREESGSLEVRKGWITKSFSREIPVSNGPAVSKLFVTLTASVEIKTERFLETGRLASYSFTGAVYAEHRIDYGADWTVLAMSRPNVTCEVADRRFGRAITGVSVEATSIATRERDVLGAIGGLAWELVGPNFDPLNPDDAIRAYDLGEEFLDQLRASPLIGAGLDLLDLLVNSEEFMEQYGALMEQTRVSVSFSLEDAQKARELAATPPTAQLDSTGESPLLLTERQHPWMPEE